MRLQLRFTFAERIFLAGAVMQFGLVVQSLVATHFMIVFTTTNGCMCSSSCCQSCSLHNVRIL